MFVWPFRLFKLPLDTAKPEKGAGRRRPAVTAKEMLINKNTKTDIELQLPRNYPFMGL